MATFFKAEPMRRHPCWDTFSFDRGHEVNTMHSAWSHTVKSCDDNSGQRSPDSDAARHESWSLDCDDFWSRQGGSSPTEMTLCQSGASSAATVVSSPLPLYDGGGARRALPLTTLPTLDDSKQPSTLTSNPIPIDLSSSSPAASSSTTISFDDIPKLEKQASIVASNFKEERGRAGVKRFLRSAPPPPMMEDSLHEPMKKKFRVINFQECSGSSLSTSSSFASSIMIDKPVFKPLPPAPKRLGSEPDLEAVEQQVLLMIEAETANVKTSFNMNRGTKMSNKLPLNKIKAIMKSNTQVKMVSAESLPLVSLAAQLFLKSLTLRAEAELETECNSEADAKRGASGKKGDASVKELRDIHFDLAMYHSQMQPVAALFMERYHLQGNSHEPSPSYSHNQVADNNSKSPTGSSFGLDTQHSLPPANQIPPDAPCESLLDAPPPSVVALQGMAQCDLEQIGNPFELHECHAGYDSAELPTFKFRHSPNLLDSFDQLSSGFKAVDSRACSFDLADGERVLDQLLSTWVNHA